MEHGTTRLRVEYTCGHEYDYSVFDKIHYECPVCKHENVRHSDIGVLCKLWRVRAEEHANVSAR